MVDDYILVTLDSENRIYFYYDHNILITEMI